MSTLAVDGAGLFYEEHGDGEPLVLVHGSWGDHNNWVLVAPELAKSRRVITYDRRGHSESTGAGTTRNDVDDLVAVIERLGPAPVDLVGNSFGSTIALKLVVSRPELIRAVFIHEPPLFHLLRDDPATRSVYDDVAPRMDAVVAVLEAGDAEAGAEQFVETVALGPGSWAAMPEPSRSTFVRNAMTWRDEMTDPDALTIDLDALSSFSKPTLISQGGQSPPGFAEVVAKLRGALPGAEHHVFTDAGHVPHFTHPDEYVATVTEFLSRA
jgi:pimeloyl-ACP methyl ester carboxylesterase